MNGIETYAVAEGLVMWLETRPLSKATSVHGPVRRNARVLFSVPIALRHPGPGGRVRATRGLSLDLSETGVGALIEGRLHVGETVMLELALAGGKLGLPAIVRHTSSIRSGFEFLGISSEDRLRLAQALGQG